MNNRKEQSYSVLFRVPVVFWQRIDVEATNRAQAIDLAYQAVDESGFDYEWSDSLEEPFEVVHVELDGQVVEDDEDEL